MVWVLGGAVVVLLLVAVCNRKQKIPSVLRGRLIGVDEDGVTLVGWRYSQEWVVPIPKELASNWQYMQKLLSLEGKFVRIDVSDEGEVASVTIDYEDEGRDLLPRDGIIELEPRP